MKTSGQAVQEMVNEQSIRGKAGISPYIWISLALAYIISPIDIIPDIPIIGWIDDFFVAAGAGLNLLEKTVGQTNQSLKTGLRILKWGVIILGVIAVTVVGLFGLAIYKLFFA
jgi:uncharacterized membrane protein YkvA (DUF1232 family)